VSSIKGTFFARKRNFFRVIGQMVVKTAQMAKAFDAKITVEYYFFEISHAEEEETCYVLSSFINIRGGS